MKTITFQGHNQNYYHTKVEHDLKTESNVINGFATITGGTKEEINIGDILNISGNNFEITEVVERRNHAGEFNNPDDKINFFFKVETKFQRIINITK